MKTAMLALCLTWWAGATETARVKKIRVVAVDARGEPVTDLKASDLQVSEDGKPKEIAFFRYMGDRPKTTVILVDLLSDRVLSDGVIGREVNATLKKLESSDDVFLYFLTARGALFPVHGLSDEGPPVENWARNAGPAIDLAVKKLMSLRPVDDYDFVYRFKLSAAAIDDLGGQMRRIPGRKSLVWIGHGTPLAGPPISGGPWIDLTTQVRELAEKLDRAQIAVYTVQQSTLGAGQELMTEGGQTLDIYTKLTGGRGYKSDRTDDALKDARSDARGSYTVAYRTNVAEADGKRHRLKVVSARKDVKLLTEAEYFSLGMDASPAEYTSWAVDTVSRNGPDAKEIGVTAALKDGQLEVRVNEADLMPKSSKVSIAIATYEGNELTDVAKPVAIAAPFTYAAKVAAKATRVRAIVTDGELGAGGSATVRVR